MKAACTDEEFIKLWNEHQSPATIAQRLQMNVRNVYVRRRMIEAARGIELKGLSGLVCGKP